jgi:hypothetical protein
MLVRLLCQIILSLLLVLISVLKVKNYDEWLHPIKKLSRNFNNRKISIPLIGISKPENPGSVNFWVKYFADR